MRLEALLGLLNPCIDKIKCDVWIYWKLCEVMSIHQLYAFYSILFPYTSLYTTTNFILKHIPQSLGLVHSSYVAVPIGSAIIAKKVRKKKNLLHSIGCVLLRISSTNSIFLDPTLAYCHIFPIPKQVCGFVSSTTK